MEVIETGLWNSFYVKIPDQNKAKDYLQEFYEQNTTFNPPSKNLLWMMEENQLGGNFCDMYLEKDCDVKYDVIFSNEDNRIPAPSIFVHSHRIENRKPQIE